MFKILIIKNKNQNNKHLQRFKIIIKIKSKIRYKKYHNKIIKVNVNIVLNNRIDLDIKMQS